MKIGVLGGGQLARMMALSAYPLDIQLICIDPKIDASAKDVTTVIHTEFGNIDKVDQYLREVDCVTYETENLPIDIIEKLSCKNKLQPTIEALKITQDRLYEKNFLNQLNIPTACYSKIEDWADLKHATQSLKFPLVLKARRNGYDGKGQAVIRDDHEANKAWELMGEYPLIAEQFITFDFEVSLISVRGISGNVVFYPLTLNQHNNGILQVSRAPYLDIKLQKIAESYALSIMEKFNYVGVMAIEFFCLNGELIANEIAPRVHNSGHWTIEGAETSQFENHLRAISGLPLGSTEAKGFSAMVNIIGEKRNIVNLLTIPGLHYHWYGKSPQPGRKLGHVTIRSDNKPKLFIDLHEALNITTAFVGDTP